MSLNVARAVMTEGVWRMREEIEIMDWNRDLMSWSWRHFGSAVLVLPQDPPNALPFLAPLS